MACARLLSVSSQVERAVQVFKRASGGSALLPGYMTVNGDPVFGSPTSMGAFCDSYYEYLLKVMRRRQARGVMGGTL